MADLNDSGSYGSNDGESLNGTSPEGYLNTPKTSRPNESLSSSFSAGLQRLMEQQEEVCSTETEELKAQIAELSAEYEACEMELASIESGQYEQNQLDTVDKELSSVETEILTYQNRTREVIEAITEYERSISRFRGQFEDEEQSLIDQDKALASEIEVIKTYVSSMEVEFSNIHQKFEKCKQVMESFTECEKQLAKFAVESNEKLRLINYLFQVSKEQTAEILERCKNEVTNMLKSNRTEYAKANANQGRINIILQSQEAVIERNDKDIKEISDMCDILIGTMSERNNL